MNRRSFGTAASAGVVGLFLPQKSEASPVEGLSNEEMAQWIVDSPDTRIKLVGATGHSMCEDHRVDVISFNADIPCNFIQRHRLGSVVIRHFYRQQQYQHRFDISDRQLYALMLSTTSKPHQCFMPTGAFGRVAGKWFLLGA